MTAKVFTIRVDEKVIAAVAAAAVKAGKSRSDWVRDLLVREVGGDRAETRRPPRVVSRARDAEAGSGPVSNAPSNARAVCNGDVGEHGYPVPTREVHESELVWHTNPAKLVADVTAGRTKIIPTGTVSNNYPMTKRPGFAGISAYPVGVPDGARSEPETSGVALPLPGGPFDSGTPKPCRHPRWRRMAGLCLRCGSEIR